MAFDPTDILDIDALEGPVGTITVFGATHTVLTLDGNSQQVVMEAHGDPATLLAAGRIAVAQCVTNPPLTPDQVQKLSSRQIMAIVAKAQGASDLVARLIKAREDEQGNASGASDGSSSPSSPIPSAPSSSESRAL